MKKKVFGNGLIAAVLGIALSFTACSDDFDYDSSSDQQSNGLLRSSGATAQQLANTGSAVQEYAGLVISKIYFTGSGTNPNSNSLINDQYIRITNNSDSTIDVGEVVVLESKFVCASNYYGFTDSISDNEFVTQVVYQIPDSHPLAAGESLLLASLKKNYSDSLGLNLSCADYEWNASPPTANSLTKIFSYSATVWTLHNRGFAAYAIAKLPTDTATFLDDYKYVGTYNLPVSRPPASGGDTVYVMPVTNAYKVPNDWIIDAVNVKSAVASERLLQTIPLSLDSGFTTSDAIPSNSTARYKRAVTRIYDEDTGKFADTNNSSNDFVTDNLIIVCN